MQPLRVQAEIQIDAPPSRVWEVLLDLPAYPEWNPFVLGMVGELGERSTLRIRLGLPEGDETAFDAVVIKCVPESELRFRSITIHPWLLEREQFWQLHPLGDEGCRFVQGMDLSGALLKLGGKTPERMARGFVYMNQALKRRTERHG
jgi:hypothetical protein